MDKAKIIEKVKVKLAFRKQKKKKSKIKIYLDMDGVLCDFDSRLNELGPGIEDSQSDEATKVILDNGVNFWYKMPWTKDGRKLWNYIKKYDVEILSAYPRRSKKTIKDAIEGKKKWVGKNLGSKMESTANIVARPEKKNYADGPNTILIDDTKQNINGFKRNGGTAILHTSADSTIAQLKELGL